MREKERKFIEKTMAENFPSGEGAGRPRKPNRL
jgi:hypothetical protein